MQLQTLKQALAEKDQNVKQYGLLHKLAQIPAVCQCSILLAAHTLWSAGIWDVFQEHQHLQAHSPSTVH